MRKKGAVTTLEERQEIVNLCLRDGMTDGQVAEKMNCSIYTVRKWRRRFQKMGNEGLQSKMGRPSGTLQSRVNAIKDDIRKLRTENPKWGAQSILVALRQIGWDRQLPSRSRLAVFLKEEKFTRRYHKHTTMPQPPERTVTEAHQKWEMDARGADKLEGWGRTSIINIMDVASRVKVESYPCVNTTHPCVADYQLALRRAFLNFGLPKQISLDHDAVFYQNTSRSPFPMRIHLWLIALDIEVRFINKPPPYNHAIIERHHQTMTAQTTRKTPFPSLAALWAYHDERRDVLNRELPMQVLAGKAPLEAYPEAIHSGRAYYPQWEHDMIDMERVYSYLACGKWYRHAGNNGSVLVGRQYFYIGHRFNFKEVAVTFSLDDHHFVFQTPDLEAVRKPIVHINKSYLMGELGQLKRLPTHQLALPLDRVEQRMANLAALYHANPV